MNNDGISHAEEEKRLIEHFALCYKSIKQNVMNGTINVRDQMNLTDAMACIFRDYIQLQQAQVAALQAIKKAKV